MCSDPPINRPRTRRRRAGRRTPGQRSDRCWQSLLWAASLLACGLALGCDDGSALPDSLTPLATAAPSSSQAPPAGKAAAFGNAAAVALPPLPALSGDRLAYRLIDHVGEAQLDQGSSSGSGSQPPSLADRLASFDSPYKLVSPYSGLRGEAALRVIEVAIADAAVDRYPRQPIASSPQPASGGSGGSGEAAPSGGGPRFDPVWNRYRGVYESKVALFAPAPSCYRFVLQQFLGSGPDKSPRRWPAGKRGQLTLHAAAIPPQSALSSGGADVEFTVSLDGQQLWRAHASRRDGTLGRWIAAEIELPSSWASDGSSHQLALCTTANGKAAGTAVWGNPELWAIDDGAPTPNLLLVLIDTLRADALPVMPRLRRYADQSVAFSQAVSAATWTRPALLGILGGDLPTAVGQSAEEMIPSERDRKRFYALDRRLLPRLLRDAGLKVASIGNNFFLLGYPQIGLSLGFDEVADVRHPVEDSPAITRAAVSFLQKQQRRSFFLQLHYDAPHWPYSPPAEYGRNLPDALVGKLGGGGKVLDPQARAYLGEAAYADAQIGQLIDELSRLGLRERTLVIVLGDHGEVFDPQHNHFVQALHQPTLYHHGWSAYDEVLRVPLVLAMPGRLPASVEVKSQVRLIDVAPTVLELLGLGSWRSLLPSGARGAGQSLLPIIFADPQRPASASDRPAFTEGQNIRALRSGGYLYLRRGDPRLQKAQGGDGIGPVYRVNEELYDLTQDPQQHHDLLASWRPTQDDGKLDAATAQALGRLRDEFARQAPLPPEQGLPLTHLMLATDSRAPHQLSGTLTSSDLALSVQGVRGGEVIPRGPGRIDVTLRAGGTVDILADPAARLELSLTRDGLPLGAQELLIGPFSLPLLVGPSKSAQPSPSDGRADAAASTSSASAAPLAIDALLLDRLSAAYPPVPGERGAVLLWRDQAAPGLTATSATAARPTGSGSEISTLMRDWGYARPETPPPPVSPPRPPDGGAAAKPPGAP